ncbi:MAG: hypothetical protein KDH15_15695 [Rhodocyclaceae bacterium]|nr:hypothetical protein [Rhodocyclaceae bacterium]
MPNLITTPRFSRNKAVLLKAQPDINTDPVPDLANDWMEARNVQFTPMEAETAERNIDSPSFGRTGKLQVAQYARLGFEIAAAANGAGVAPKHAPALLACAMQQSIAVGVSVTYNLVSAAIPACAIYINFDGVLHKMLACRGTVALAISASGIPVWRFEFQSVYVAPSDLPLGAATMTGWPLEEPVNAAKTGPISINGVNLAFSTFETALGNQIEKINLPGPQVECAIVDRAPTGSVTVLAPLLAVFDPFALAEAGTNVALNLTHGSAAGKQVQVDEKIVITNVAYDQIRGMPAYKLDFEPTKVNGNDEIAFTFL